MSTNTGMTFMEDGDHSDTSSICNSPGDWPGSRKEKRKELKPKKKSVAPKKLTKRLPTGATASSPRTEALTELLRKDIRPENPEVGPHTQKELGTFTDQVTSSSTEHGFIGGLKLRLANETSAQGAKISQADRFKMSKPNIVIHSDDEVRPRMAGSRSITWEQDAGSRLKEVKTVELWEDAHLPTNSPAHNQTSYASRIAKESSRIAALTRRSSTEAPPTGRKSSRPREYSVTTSESNYQPVESGQRREATRHQNMRAAVDDAVSSARTGRSIPADQYPTTPSLPKRTYPPETAKCPSVSLGQNNHERKCSVSSASSFDVIAPAPQPDKPRLIEPSAPDAPMAGSCRAAVPPTRSSRQFWRRGKDKGDQISGEALVENTNLNVRPLHLPARTSGPPSTQLQLQSQEPLAKLFVVCCNCNLFHDLPSKIYEAMAKTTDVIQDIGVGTSADAVKAVGCPWCLHVMTVKCCSSYAAVVYIRECFH